MRCLGTIDLGIGAERSAVRPRHPNLSVAGQYRHIVGRAVPLRIAHSALASRFVSIRMKVRCAGVLFNVTVTIE